MLKKKITKLLLLNSLGCITFSTIIAAYNGSINTKPWNEFTIQTDDEIDLDYNNTHKIIEIKNYKDLLKNDWMFLSATSSDENNFTAESKIKNNQLKIDYKISNKIISSEDNSIITFKNNNGNIIQKTINIKLYETTFYIEQNISLAIGEEFKKCAIKNYSKLINDGYTFNCLNNNSDICTCNIENEELYIKKNKTGNATINISCYKNNIIQNKSTYIKCLQSNKIETNSDDFIFKEINESQKLIINNYLNLINDGFIISFENNNENIIINSDNDVFEIKIKKNEKTNFKIIATKNDLTISKPITIDVEQKNEILVDNDNAEININNSLDIKILNYDYLINEFKGNFNIINNNQVINNCKINDNKITIASNYFGNNKIIIQFNWSNNSIIKQINISNTLPNDKDQLNNLASECCDKYNSEYNTYLFNEKKYGSINFAYLFIFLSNYEKKWNITNIDELNNKKNEINYNVELLWNAYNISIAYKNITNTNISDDYHFNTTSLNTINCNISNISIYSFNSIKNSISELLFDDVDNLIGQI